MENAGIEVNEVETVKGSCHVKGLSIGSGRIRPAFYEQTISGMNAEELMGFAQRTMAELPAFDPTEKLTKAYILENCISCVRHETEGKTVRDRKEAVKWKVYGDLEEYIRVDLGEDPNGNHMSLIVTNSLLASVKLSKKSLRDQARRHLRESVLIRSMPEVLNEIIRTGCVDVFRDPPEIPEEIMYVATNRTGQHGAAVMLLDDVLLDFCRKHGLRGVNIIPSSLHEVILVSPDTDGESLNAMIREVNQTEVDEWDRLSDHVYFFSADPAKPASSL